MKSGKKKKKKSQYFNIIGAYFLVFFYCVYEFPVNTLLMDTISLKTGIIFLKKFFLECRTKKFQSWTVWRLGPCYASVL